ncbi:MAG TPA: Mrp/NBP35 family ATP-binding protein [Azospirillaceae bacterium]|nr:Mrp/NBP35 family ATP-binding protein [Azospirillaceae bacterium]
MAQITEAQVAEALRQVTDPDQGRDIVSLGMVTGLAVREGHVSFAVEVDPRRGPALEPLRQAAEQAVARLPGVTRVTAVLTAHRTAAPTSPPPPPAQPQPARAGRTEVAGVRAIVAVASGKGGVGKSTTAANLALGLAAQGLRVGLLDADVYGPSMPRMMGLSGRPNILEGRRMEPLAGHGVKVMSIGFLVPEEQPTIWRGPMVMGAIQQMLRDVAWGELDVLLVDMPPGTGDAQLTLCQQVQLAGAVIVSTPQDIALLDARKGLEMFRRVDVPVLGIIENMSYFCCPNCGHRTDVFSHGGARTEAERLGVEFLGEIPLDIRIRETSDGGAPIVVSEPDSPHAAAYRAIAARVWGKVAGGPHRPAPRIVVQ